MADQLAGLKAALADRYRIERPLGAGGMAIVYLGEDLKHHRKVALKVLKPELAEALGPQRFLNEIKVVAQLNHPHILALYDSGEADGDLYFVMPVAEGESLRAKLDRIGQLPIAEAVRVAQHVASALDYAHRQGVLHRDIKPENILLHEGEAMVTDFGIAVPMDAASDTRLTEVGESLGTADYMSPEQSKGERELDARSDVYALGCVLFEMLAGEPPFKGHNRQSVIGKRITEPPPRVTTRRGTVPEGLADIVTKALAMSPSDRYDSAASFAAALAHHATTAAGPLTRLNHPVIAATLFGVSSLAIVAAVYIIMLQLGLPDWVPQAAIGLLVIGLPIIVATALSERQRVARAGRQHRLLNWRRALQGGGLAFTALTVFTTGFMAMRSLGIGPVGTLMAKGVLESRDPILLAEFANETPDPTLAATITEGLRIDLSQSRVVRLVEPTAVSAALERMVVDPDAPLDEALARQVAEREGVKAVLAGAVAPVGRGYMLSARLVSPADGVVFHAVRVNAKDDAQLLTAIDQLSARLRARIGESLKDVRASPALDRVTTSSVEALRKYTQAVQLGDQANDPESALPLLQEAVALDTNFAMAYRKLGNILAQDLGRTADGIAAFRRAFELRERLPERERYLIEAHYYGVVEPGNLDKLVAAYRSTLALDPEDHVALTNLASNLANRRQWAERESLALRAVDVSGIWQAYANALNSQLRLGRFAEFQATLDRFAEAHPGHVRIMVYQIELAITQRDYDRAEELLREQLASGTWGNSRHALGDLLQLRGRWAEAETVFREWAAAENTAAFFPPIYHLAVLHAERGASADAMRMLDAYPLDSLPPVERPYLQFAEVYAAAGRVDRARAVVTDYETHVPPAQQRGRIARQALRQISGEIALQEGRFADAVTDFEAVNELSGGCGTCGLARLAYALQHIGQEDSALSVYEHMVSTPITFLDVRGIRAVGISSVRGLPHAYQRLGALYEARGDTTKAIDAYNEFVELWKNADPELQPQVEDVRRRIANLIGEPR